MKQDTDKMMMGIEVINILARVQASYGKYFTMKVWNRAEQIARDAGRNVLEVEDMKAALRELL